MSNFSISCNPTIYTLLSTAFLFHITLFNFYEEGSIPYNKEREHTVVYYKWNDKKYPKPFTSEKFVFKYSKKMAAFVADDIELSAKVLNKEKGYGLVDIYNTIEEYNEWYIVNNQ